MTEYRTGGKTTLTSDVLMTIARMAALGVDGVCRMAPVRSKKLLNRGEDGIFLEIEDDFVFLDLFLILNKDINVRDIGREVQEHVARAITEMTGLEVGHVNVHIEDIDYE